MESLKNFTDILHNIVVMAAAVVGGLWVLNRIKRERTDQAALEMMVTPSSIPINGKHLVVLTVQLTNKGKTKLAAKCEKENGYTFSENSEHAENLKHACSLQLKKLKQSAITRPERLNWFAGGTWEDKILFDNEPEINVLIEYENPDKGDKVEFWMEPGETYRLGVPVILEEGEYLAKLTFVGGTQEKEWLDKVIEELGAFRSEPRMRDEDFWSQICGFKIPVEEDAENKS